MLAGIDSGLLKYLTEDVINLAEATGGERCKIYVVLSNTKTHFSKIAAAITGQSYNHISIAFDRTLEQLYTFDIGANTIEVEALSKFDELAELIVYSVEVTREAANRVRERIEHILRNSSAYLYSRMTLLKTVVNQIVGRVIFPEDRNLRDEYICSTFVAEMLRIANVELFKDGRIPAPHDFKGHRVLKYEYRGTARTIPKKIAAS